MCKSFSDWHLSSFLLPLAPLFQPHWIPGTGWKMVPYGTFTSQRLEAMTVHTPKRGVGALQMRWRILRCRDRYQLPKWTLTVIQHNLIRTRSEHTQQSTMWWPQRGRLSDAVTSQATPAAFRKRRGQQTLPWSLHRECDSSDVLVSSQ